MEFRILNIAFTALLFGATYYEAPEEGYSYELNIFLGIIALQWRWYA